HRDGACVSEITTTRMWAVWQDRRSRATAPVSADDGSAVMLVAGTSGALTQLVECHLCKVEVRGSSPLCSTAELPSQTPLTREFVCFRLDSSALKGTAETFSLHVRCTPQPRVRGVLTVMRRFGLIRRLPSKRYQAS